MIKSSKEARAAYIHELSERSPKDSLAAYIHELSRDYLKWYEKSVKRCYAGYWSLQITNLLAGFLTAVLAALGAERLGKLQSLLVILPLCGSLCAGCLVQFRVYDLWRLRETGRLAFQNLVTSARRRFASATSDAECAIIHQELQTATDEIESNQSTSFFAMSPTPTTLPKSS